MLYHSTVVSRSGVEFILLYISSLISYIHALSDDITGKHWSLIRICRECDLGLYTKLWYAFSCEKLLQAIILLDLKPQVTEYNKQDDIWINVQPTWV